MDINTLVQQLSQTGLLGLLLAATIRFGVPFALGKANEVMADLATIATAANQLTQAATRLAEVADKLAEKVSKL